MGAFWAELRGRGQDSTAARALPNEGRSALHAELRRGWIVVLAARALHGASALRTTICIHDHLKDWDIE